MSDLAPLTSTAQGEERDRVPELPLGPSVAGAYANAALHNAHHAPASPDVSPVIQHSAGPHHGSHSNVDLAMFDPAGVNRLGRTLSRMSQEPAEATKVPGTRSIESESSHGTAVDESFSLEKTLKDLLQKGGEAGLLKRELGVVFENLRVVGLGASATYQPTLASMLNPLNIIQGIHSMRHPALRNILDDFNGVVRPGEMLLVLGRPGAGCTTLLRTLANQRDEYYAVEGAVHYDSFTPAEVHKYYRGDVQYSPEDDVHFPTLTVAETLRFAAKTRTPHSRLPGTSREDFVALMTDIVTTVFGLRHVKDTLVGDAAIRGVSGGEKKRVSISEALASRSILNSWDNSTRGLDASTALEFVQALRIATDLARMTTIVSIYQAGENLYKLFDKVCVLYEGRMAYFGPADQARAYFGALGYAPADRQTTADFLVAVTDPHGRSVRPGFEAAAPRTAAEFAAAFARSEYARLNAEDIAAYKREAVGNAQRVSVYRDSVRAEHARTARPASAYITSIPMQARALMVRRAQILKGGMAIQIVQLLTFVIQAVIIGTVFVRLPDATSAFFSRGGVIFL
ncbi:pleiotropic drug resistance ABC transporter, partial [Phanerochaete sordida]